MFAATKRHGESNDEHRARVAVLGAVLQLSGKSTVRVYSKQPNVSNITALGSCSACNTALGRVVYVIQLLVV